MAAADQIEKVLALGSFVRSLARRLALEDDRAEDLVQETWLAALRRPPRSGSNLRAWLGQVVRNLARRAARGEERRSRREIAAARPEGVPSAAQVLEDEAVSREAVRAVLNLIPLQPSASPQGR